MTTKLRVLFADDELMARKRMRRLLEAMEGVEIVGEYGSGEEVLAALDRTDVDVVLLDVRMGAVSGLDVSDTAAELGVEVVLVTAHPEHAASAYERGAVDYVLKPVEPERLKKALDRVRERIRVPRAEPADRLALTVRGEVRLVSPDDVSHAILEGSLVTVYARGEALLTDLSLNELERRLPARFERVHRRALVNLARVERLKPLPSGGYIAVTDGGHEVPVSRQAARALRRRFGIT
ncbi:MAG TPA: LytTR family DNA-binding domain-containing protein [Sandaracinaceae bacterium]